MIMDWLLNQVPYWVWALIVGGPALVAVLIWKPQWLAPAAGAIGLFALAGKLRQDGYNARVKKDREDADRLIGTTRAARARADRDNATDDGLRKDDGHKRR